jgi:hypothetical protein
MGDHAENSFMVDGQPITDQQSKVFSNQIPLDSIASMEVISGAPPAEFGEKTSVVINTTTRSGQGLTTPTGSVTTNYGSFGTSTAGLNLGYGGQKWGNFISLSGLNTGRFLDPPEFTVIHAKGNEENVFDRFDYQLSKADSLQLNLGFTRSWFQNPNSFDNVLHSGQTDPSGARLHQPDPAIFLDLDHARRDVRNATQQPNASAGQETVYFAACDRSLILIRMRLPVNGVPNIDLPFLIAGLRRSSVSKWRSALRKSGYPNEADKKKTKCSDSHIDDSSAHRDDISVRLIKELVFGRNLLAHLVANLFCSSQKFGLVIARLVVEDDSHGTDTVSSSVE